MVRGRKLPVLVGHGALLACGPRLSMMRTLCASAKWTPVRDIGVFNQQPHEPNLLNARAPRQGKKNALQFSFPSRIRGALVLIGLRCARQGETIQDM